MFNDSVKIIKSTFIEFFKEKSLMHGAALAYYSLLALIPILYLAFTYIGQLIGHDQVIEITSSLLEGYVGIQDSSNIIEFLDSIDLTKKSVFLQIAGILALIFSASAIMNSLKKSLNAFYNVEIGKRRKREIILKSITSRLISMLFVVGVTTIVIALYFAETVFLTLGSKLFEESHFWGWLFSGIVRHGIPILTNVVIFSFIFKFLHDGVVSWKMALRGSLLTSLLMYIGQLLIKLYLVNYFFAFEAGIGGTLLILLVWVYYSSQIIFFGAKYITERIDFYGGQITRRD
jgi:membrane protein